METIKIKIRRSSPAGGKRTRLEEFTVPFEEGMHVYDALEYITEQVDPSLAFRHSCGITNCEICLIKINGKTGYACKEKLEDGQVLEPLDQFEHVRDLVTDLNKRVKTR